MKRSSPLFPRSFFASTAIVVLSALSSGCSSEQKITDANPPPQTADAQAATTDENPDQGQGARSTEANRGNSGTAESGIAHDDTWSAIHYGTSGLPPAIGGVENVAELGVLLNATGTISSFIDFEACLKRGIAAACESHDKPGVRQDMTKPAEPVALNFDELTIPSQVLVVFAVPAAIEKDLRQNWKTIQTTYSTQSWKSLVQALTHFAVMSKFQDFSAFQFVDEHWVKMLKRWNPKVEIPSGWAWHERVAIFMDPTWGTSTLITLNKKAWLRSVRQSPVWIWNGLIQSAARNSEDMSAASAYGWKEQLQAIRAFDDLRPLLSSASAGGTVSGAAEKNYAGVKVNAKTIRDQENAIHRFQRRMQGSTNCWNRFRVSFRHMTLLAQEHKELTDAQMSLFNGKTPAHAQAAVLKTLNADTPAAHALALNLDLYRDEETRPLVFQFDGAWANWIAGLKSRGVTIGDDVSHSPLLECSLKYDQQNLK